MLLIFRMFQMEASPLQGDFLRYVGRVAAQPGARLPVVLVVLPLA